MKDKLKNFFRGRYGNDQFNIFLLTLTLLFLMVRMIFKIDWLSLPALAIVIYSNYRLMSKNIAARHQENQKYLLLKNRIVHSIKWFFLSIFGSNGYKFKKCPSCKGELKIPKKKGKLKVTCPHCRHSFETRT